MVCSSVQNSTSLLQPVASTVQEKANWTKFGISVIALPPLSPFCRNLAWETEPMMCSSTPNFSTWIGALCQLIIMFVKQVRAIASLLCHGHEEWLIYITSRACGRCCYEPNRPIDQDDASSPDQAGDQVIGRCVQGEPGGLGPPHPVWQYGQRL